MSEDDLDEYEYSDDDPKYKKNGPGSSRKVPNTYDNKPYDEAYEISQDLSVAESFDAKEKVLPSQRYDILCIRLYLYRSYTIVYLSYCFC